MSRYELMFGAISVVMICRVLARSATRDVHELPRLQRERLGSDRPRRPRPRRQPDQDRLGRVAVHVDVRGDDDEDRQRRDDEDDVREHVQDVVDPASSIAGREADRGAEEPGDPPGLRRGRLLAARTRTGRTRPARTTSSRTSTPKTVAGRSAR